MPSEKPKRDPPAPPPIDEVPRDLPLTAENIVKLASVGLTRAELAAYFDVTEEFLAVKYAKALSRGRARRTVWLRKLQMKSAEEGNVSIQIMLGKQELKQGEDPAATEDRVIRRRTVDRAKKPLPPLPPTSVDEGAKEPDA
jgi:hypothetical protein